jgi:hypothetical protein
MKSGVKMSIIALALGVGLAACGRDEGRRSDTPGSTSPTAKAPDTTSPAVKAPDAPAPGATSPGSTARMSDSDLEKAVKSKLESDEQLRAAKLKVDANADKNEVTLSGTVSSQELRNKAVDMAKNAHSGITVNDKIDVKPAA